MASTLITPDSGSVHMGEIDATLLSLAEKAQLRWDRLGIVFQQANLLPAPTAREQLVVMGELGGGRHGPRARRAAGIRADLLPDAVGLLGQAGKRPARLTVEHDTARVLVTHDQRLLPLMDSLHTMVDGTRTTSRHSVSA